MSWTLYRYILKDVLKLLVLATVVSISVISLAAAIRPLADGLLTPWQLAKFIFYISPTMLGFILPFTVAFATTITFTRLSQDNELMACSASGMSYRSILAPVMGLGVALAIGMFLLSNIIIPRFFREASDLIERDALTVLTAQLNRNLPFKQGEWVIYADEARELPLTEEMRQQYSQSNVTPRRLIELRGVAVANLASDGKVGSDATAERATAMLFNDNETSQSWVALQLRNAVYFDPIRGKLSNRRWSPLLRVPDRFSDNPKFLSWWDLNRLSRSPQLFDRVREVQERIMAQMSRDRLREVVTQALQSSAEDKRGKVKLLGPREGEAYVFQAGEPESAGDRQLYVGSKQTPVEVIKLDNGRPVRWFEANQAVVNYTTLEGEREPVMAVELDDVMVLDAGEGAQSTEHVSLQLPMLRWPEDLSANVPRSGMGWVMTPLKEQARLRADDDDRLSDLLHELGDEVLALHHDIAVLHNERLAAAAAVFLLTLVGALLSIQLRHQMVLVVYMWSFGLAIVNVILINTGPTFARVTEYPIAMKAGLMWSGNLLIVLLCVAMYRRMARH